MNAFKYTLLFSILIFYLGEPAFARSEVNTNVSLPATGEHAKISYSSLAMGMEEEEDTLPWIAVDSKYTASIEKYNELKNKAPKAHAGENQKLTDVDGDGKETVQLDGSKSEDKDGSIVSYSWSFEGSDAELAQGVNPVVELSLGSATIVLTVTDDEGQTDNDKVKITIREQKGNEEEEEEEEDEDDDGGEGDDDEEEEEEEENVAPEAHAGENQELIDADLDGWETVVLDGSGSADQNGFIVSYSWIIEGTEEVLATGVNPGIDLPVGNTTIVLTVIDDGGLTATDRVEISIMEGEHEEEGDEDEDDNGGEEGNDDEEEEDNEDDAGEDQGDESDEDEEEEPENVAPEAHAGENQELMDADLDGREKVVLNGSGSADQDGIIVSYSWSIEGAEEVLATGVNPQIALPVGNTTIVLTVIDNGGLTATDRVEISIMEGEQEEEGDEDEDQGNDEEGNDNGEEEENNDGNQGEEDEQENEGGGEEEESGSDGQDTGENLAPEAHAGEDQELTDSLGDGKEEITLDGSKSEDIDGSIVSYSWSVEGTEEVLATGISPSVELPLGNTTLVLTVTDDGGLTATDTVVISIVNEVVEGGTAFLPNLFSPNGDQMNDRFILHCTNVEKVHWRIYNRQGRLVYETQDLEEATQIGWDGTAFGESQPAGSYIWILEGSYLDGTAVSVDGKIKGSVTLIR